MSLTRHKSDAREALTVSQFTHELNNLLDGSLRCVTMALRELNTASKNDMSVVGNDSDLVKRLQTADHSMQLMAQVIERFANSSDAANPDADTAIAHVVHSEGRLLDALTHAINVYGPTIEQKNIELVTRLDPLLSDVHAGPLYTVLANAINNALQAIERSDHPGPHRITLRLVVDATGHALLEVLDTGEGFCPSLFDQKKQFRFGCTTRPEGHGVGLGVCRQIAHDLGGHLSLENTSPRGAALRLRYPLAGMEA